MRGPVAERALHLSHLQAQHPQSSGDHGEWALTGPAGLPGPSVELMSMCSQTSLPCVDNVVLDVERLGISQASGSHRMLLGDSNQPSINLDQLSPPHTEATPRTPADVSTAVSSKTTHMWMKGQGRLHNMKQMCLCSQAAATSSTGTPHLLAASCVRWSCLTSRPHLISMKTSPETTMEALVSTHYRHLLTDTAVFIFFWKDQQ